MRNELNKFRNMFAIDAKQARKNKGQGAATKFWLTGHVEKGLFDSKQNCIPYYFPIINAHVSTLKKLRHLLTFKHMMKAQWATFFK